MVEPIIIGTGLYVAGTAALGWLRRRQRLAAKAPESANLGAAGRSTDPRAQATTVQATSSPTATTVAAASKPVTPPAAQTILQAPQTASKDQRLAGPAYPGLVQAAPEVRRALVEIAEELQLPVFALSTVIQSESEWDPTVPKKEAGTPRAGLIQLTVGAHLAPWKSKADIWALRKSPAEWQLRNVALPYFKRFGKRLESIRTHADPAFALYQLNFLPGDASKPDTFYLGEKDNLTKLPGSTITRHDVWHDNPGFAAGKNYFTWADVRKRVRLVEKAARGKWVLIDGTLVDPPDARTPAKTVNVGTPVSPTFAEGASCSVAVTLRTLLREIDQHFPNRLRVSDGLCGDSHHQARTSDHNTGNALDVTLDAANGPNLDALASLLLADPRVQYVIWNQRIANRDVDGGAWRAYPTSPELKGKVNPHTRHLHVSIKAPARDDAKAWGVERLKKSAPSSPAEDSTDALLRNPVKAWREGKVDNFAWVPLTVGDYQLEVSPDCLAVNGIRLPVSFADVVAICKSQDMVPNTKAVCDARWAQGDKRIVLRDRPPTNHGPDAQLAIETRQWSAKIGPITKVLKMGPWKEWVLNDVLLPKQATNYGLWGPNGSPIQSLGHRHNDLHVDDSQFFAPIRRTALFKGQRVNLLDELARGCPLGGPLPSWLVEALR